MKELVVDLDTTLRYTTTLLYFPFLQSLLQKEIFNSFNTHSPNIRVQYMSTELIKIPAEVEFSFASGLISNSMESFRLILIWKQS